MKERKKYTTEVRLPKFDTFHTISFGLYANRPDRHHIYGDTAKEMRRIVLRLPSSIYFLCTFRRFQITNTLISTTSHKLPSIFNVITSN